MSVASARTTARSTGIVVGAGAAVLVIILVAGFFLVRHVSLQATDSGASMTAGEVGTCGGVTVTAPRDLRGMWLTTVYNIDFPSTPGLDEATVKAEYRSWLDLAQRRNHNAIYVHVRPSGDAFWPSKYAPWSEWLTGRRDGVGPGWDPLEWMVAETHARNIEFHAWFNPYRGGQPAPNGPGADLNQLAPDHPLRAHPEWAIVYPVGKPSARLYFDPGIPEARKFVEDSMLEAVARYDLDGVDFDDFFYPYPEAGQDFGDAGSFATYGGKFASRADWRRDNVNTLVRETNQRIKALKPWVKFGISTFGIWRNSVTDPTGSATKGLQSFDEIYADSKAWVKNHWVDSITPQLYWHIGNPAADHAILVKWWSALVEGTGVQLYIAYGDYRVGEAGAWRDPAELDRQMTLDDKYTVDGTVHYSAKSVRDDALGAVSLYSAAHYATPSLMPLMSHLPAHVPPAPSPAVRTRPDGVEVTWRPVRNAVSYAVYRGDRLIGTTRRTSFVDTTLGGRYCVSALDRTWNESRLSDPVGVG